MSQPKLKRPTIFKPPLGLVILAALVALIAIGVRTGVRTWQGHTYVKKVEARLDLIQRDFAQYKQIHGVQPTNPKMIALSSRLANNDQLIVPDLDQAKRHGVNVKPLAHEFCELLEDQARVIKVGDLKASAGDLAILNQNAKIIESSLTVAMMWE